ncbi:ankyrin [Penicillium sp. IBT 35674x]|nr:ankyrin [Penicillium sp. IBT 35674x]
MSLFSIPPELRQQIFSNLESQSDLNALACTNRYFYLNLNNSIYRNEIRKDGGYVVLLYAAQTGSLPTAGHLLDAEKSFQNYTNDDKRLRHQIDPNGPTPGRSGWSPLAWASMKGFEEMVKLLLNMKNIDPDTRCSRGRTALSYAAEQGHVKIVRLLLEAGADPNSQDQLQRTPLHWAGSPRLTRGIHYEPLKLTKRDTRILSSNGPCNFWGAKEYLYEFHVESLRHTIENSTSPVFCSVDAFFNVHVPGTEEYNNIHTKSQIYGELDDLGPDLTVSSSILYGEWSSGKNYEHILDLLIQNGVKIDVGGHSPLNWAAAFGYQPLVELLLNRGAQAVLNTEVGMISFTLAIAAKHGHAAIVEILLDRFPSANDPQYAARLSALSLAAMNGHDDVVRCLTTKTSERERSFRGPGWQPLTVAARKGHTDLVDFLISVHKQKWPEYSLGYTAISEAAYCGHTDIVLRLMSAGADYNATPGAFGKMGCLHLAAKNGHSETVKSILETGRVDVNAVDGHGWTAYSWTSSDKRKSGMQEILLKGGANPSFQKSEEEIRRAPHSIMMLGNGCFSGCCFDEERWPISFR